MPEIIDKLDHDERLRLEALAQAVQLTSQGGYVPQAADVVKFAQVFETYIKGETQ